MSNRLPQTMRQTKQDLSFFFKLALFVDKIGKIC
jgi:hypothetical protein